MEWTRGGLTCLYILACKDLKGIHCEEEVSLITACFLVLVRETFLHRKLNLYHLMKTLLKLRRSVQYASVICTSTWHCVAAILVYYVHLSDCNGAAACAVGVDLFLLIS